MRQRLQVTINEALDQKDDDETLWHIETIARRACATAGRFGNELKSKAPSGNTSRMKRDMLKVKTSEHARAPRLADPGKTLHNIGWRSGKKVLGIPAAKE